MSTIVLELDRKMQHKFQELKSYFNFSSNADLIRRAISLLDVAKTIDETNGKLVAKKGDKEGEIKFK
jgi:hypothetical protein